MIKIDVLRLFRLDGTGPLRAFVDIIVEDAIVIKGIKVIDGKEGLLVKMPSEAGKDGKSFAVVVLMKRDVKDEIEKMVLEAYNS